MKYTYINMKVMKFLGIIAFVTMLTSCEDFLDLKPISSTTVATFYENEDDFDQAVNGAYANLKSVYGEGYYMLFADLRADNTSMLVPGSGSETRKIEIDNFSLDPTNEHPLTYWRESYRTLQRANGVLSHIDGVDFDQTKKDQYIGESEALRALVYFNLVRIFGGVPIVTVGDVDIDESYNMPRASVQEVYDLIISDLTDAANLLPDSYPDSEAGKITSGAAKSLLGLVYLTLKDYSNAVTQFQQVIGSGEYALLSKYEDNFMVGMQGNQEAVWQVLYSSVANGMGSGFPNWCAPNGSDGILVGISAYGFNQPTLDMYEDYEPGDLRRDASIGLGYFDSEGIWKDAKYIKLYVEQDNPGKARNSDADWNVLRYSQVLLLCAEAINEVSGPTSEAYGYINEVRQRAGLPELSGLDQNAFREAVYHEERVEGAFEGHRWFDLIRTGRAISVLNSKITPDPEYTVGPSEPIDEHDLLYPIPSAVITTSAPGVIVQNPGY